MKRSLAASLIAVATLAASLSLTAPAQAAGDDSIHLGLDQARDLLRRGALDDPSAAPSFVSGDNELVEVHDGAVTARLDGLTGAADLVDYGTAIVVDLPSLGKLAVVDITSGLVERGRVNVGANSCPRHLFASGGGIWFFVGCSAPYRIARAVIPEDPTAPLADATVFDSAGDPSWASLPTIVPVESGVWIGSAEGVRAYTLSSFPIPGTMGAAVDASTLVSSSSGGQLLAGSGSQYWKLSGDTGALQGGPFPAPANWDAVHYFAGFAPGILMGSAGSTDPLELRASDNSLIRKIPPPPGAGALVKGTLAYDGSKATALWDTADGTDTILGSMDARPRITVVLAVDFTRLGDLVMAHVHGHLTDPAGKPKRVGIDLVHTDRRGDHADDISADASGHFEADLQLTVGGPNTITVVTQFDSSWAASSDSVSVDLPAPAWDITGRGGARIVVGAPGEDVGSAANAGAFTVVGANAGGGPTASGSVEWTQDSPGVPGTAVTGNGFGRTIVSGDFDRDGYADLAIGTPLEKVGGAEDAGTVTIMYGSATGLTSTGAWAFDTSVAGLAPGAAGRLGWALAAGDFDGDGYEDLTAGAPGQEVTVVLEGSPAGLTGTGARIISQWTAGVPGTKHAGDRFGTALTTADFTGDGRSDLAVGAPLDTDGHTFAAGSVTVLRGSAAGLTTTSSAQITKESTGVIGVSTNDPGHPDRFGETLASGFLTTDSLSDLVIGSPGSPVTVDGAKRRSAGVVHVLPGSTSGVTATGDQMYSQQTDGIGGVAEAGDQFGLHLDAGQASPTYVALLAVQSAGDGSIHVIPGVAPAAEEKLDQNTAGVPGTTEAGDDFGTTLRFVPLSGPGYGHLVVGVPGENDDAGGVIVFPGYKLTVRAIGSWVLSPASTGMAGQAESGDRWGWMGDSH